MRALLSAVFGLAVVAATLLGSARPVRACSPPPPGLTGTRPASGSSLPANASIFFDGFNLSLNGVTVTVNGAAAGLTEEPSPFWWSKAGRVTPQPAVGATITMTGTFCEAANNCNAQSLTFTALAPDTTAPSVPTLEVNVHDYADFSGGIGSCQSDSAAAWWFNLQGAVAGAGDAQVLHVVELARDNSFTTVVHTATGTAETASEVVALRLDNISIGSLGVTQAFCFRAYSVDTAGQRSANTAVTCRPCHARVDGQVDGGIAFSPPEQPTWTSGDIVGDGPCGTTSSSSSGGGSSSAVGVSTSFTGSSSRAGSSSTAGSSSRAGSSSTAGTSTGNSSSTVVGSSSSAAPDAGVKDINVDPGAGCNCRGTETSPLMWGALVMLGWVAARKRRR